MARVTQAEVEEIIDNPDSIAMDAFITAANLLVTEKLGSAGLSAALLKEIERWLAAHFFAIRDPRAKREEVGRSEIWYEGSWGRRLEFTRWGQQVMVLDPTGTLAKLGLPGAKFAVVSTGEIPTSSS